MTPVPHSVKWATAAVNAGARPAVIFGGATADEVPEMQLAETKYNRAKGNMADESYRNARMRAEQAELDARLAEAKVLTKKSEEQLNVLNTRIVRLRKQLQLGEAQ